MSDRAVRYFIICHVGLALFISPSALAIDHTSSPGRLPSKAPSRSSGPRGAVAANEPFTSEIMGPFDYLMFTQIYPAAVCRADDDTVPDSCEIPRGAPTWTIHGLWPNYKDGTYPEFCDHRKFDPDQVASIRQKLELDWPNLYPTKTGVSFWKHEWEKHGTCAKGDALVETQIKYFNSSLLLRSRLDIFSALEADSIRPGPQALDKSKVSQALLRVSNGHRLQIHCLRDKKTKEWLLGDVRLCMDWDLNPMECPEEEEEEGATAIKRRRLRSTRDDGPPLPEFQRCPDTIYYVSTDPSVELEPPPWSVLCLAVPALTAVLFLAFSFAAVVVARFVYLRICTDVKHKSKDIGTGVYSNPLKIAINDPDRTPILTA